MSIPDLQTIISFLTRLTEEKDLINLKTKVFSLLYFLFKTVKRHCLTQIRQGNPSDIILLSSFYKAAFGLKIKMDAISSFFDPYETVSFFTDVKMDRWLKLPPESFQITQEVFSQYAGDSRSNKYNVNLYQHFSAYIYLIGSLYAKNFIPKSDFNTTFYLFQNYISGTTCTPQVSLTLFERRVQTMLMVSSFTFYFFVFIVSVLVCTFLNVKYYSSHALADPRVNPHVLTQPLP